MRWLAWLLLLGIVAVGALLQGATAIPGYAGASGVAFWLAAAASVLVLLAEAIALPWAAAGATRPEGLGRLPGSLVVWGAAVTVAALVLAVFVPVALPLLWPLAIVLLSTAATGRGNAFAGFAAFRRHPWAASAALLVALLAGVLGGLVALLAGLLLTGFLGGLVAWAWIGLVSGLVLTWWTHLLRPS